MTEPSGGIVVRAVELAVQYGRGRGISRGLGGFSACFHPGIAGLVGPNGAGKSTFLRAVLGLVEPRAGHVLVGNRSPASYLSRRPIGFLPENPVLPDYLRVGEFLEGLSGREGPASSQRTEESRGRVPVGTGGVTPLLSRPLSSLSLGERKKVALAAALLGLPDLLLLDEPTNGLDPLAMDHLRRTLLAERRRGATLIVSSHHLDELQRIADVLVFVNAGRAAGSWTRRQALERFGSLDGLFRHVFRDHSGRLE